MTILDMDGGILKQNNRLQYTHISCSHPDLPLFSFCSAPLTLHPPHLLSPYLCLRIHFSFPLSSLHLPRHVAWGKMSYVVYKSGIYLDGSARTVSLYISVTVGCNTARLTCRPKRIMADYVYCKDTHIYNIKSIKSHNLTREALAGIESNPFYVCNFIPRKQIFHIQDLNKISKALRVHWKEFLSSQWRMESTKQVEFDT